MTQYDINNTILSEKIHIIIEEGNYLMLSTKITNFSNKDWEHLKVSTQNPLVKMLLTA